MSKMENIKDIELLRTFLNYVACEILNIHKFIQIVLLGRNKKLIYNFKFKV